MGEKRRDLSTDAVHAGVRPDPATGAIMTPVYLTSTYVQGAPGRHKGYEYSRTGNPTRSALEENLAALEGGARGLCFASGCAAAAAVLHALKPGDKVVAGRDLYGGTYRLFMDVFAPWGLRFTFVDTTDLAACRRAIDRGTRLVWVETPSNPLLSVSDIRVLARLARGRGALLAVDNTFATPCLQRPLELGADLVVHSTTKYLGGHSDVVGGAVVTRAKGLGERLRFLQNAVGAVPGPLDCFLVLRGIKTLPLRMKRHCASALTVARHLGTLPDVRRVHYPGLELHPQFELARRQMHSAGGMISFELSGGVPRALRMLQATRLFALAESLGGVESLISHPATMTHASIPKPERTRAGVTDGLLRLSVGLEDPEDLLEDLDQALARSRGRRGGRGRGRISARRSL